MSTSQSNEEMSEVENDVKEDKPSEVAVKDGSWYLPLYKAALKGDWESAKSFFDKDKDAVTAKIGKQSRTALHIAVGTGESIHFVQHLVNLMPIEALALGDVDGNTALHIAALVGNTEAAIIMLEKNPALIHIRHYGGRLPVHRAAICARKDTLRHLLDTHYKVDNTTDPGFLAGQSGVLLLVRVIESRFLDVALELVARYPNLAALKLQDGDSALLAIARKASAFTSGSDLNLWESLIYSCVSVPVQFEDYLKNPDGGDIEDPVDKSMVLQASGSPRLYSVWKKLHLMVWEAIKWLVPQIKHIQSRKSMHHQALCLVEILCKQIRSLNDAKAYASLYERPVLLAAKLGIHEVVEMIVNEFPDAIYSSDDLNKHYIFKMAVENRSEKIFNFVYQMTDYRNYASLVVDHHKNNIFHTAGRLAPAHKLDLVPGAALQMQCEIQWFKEVEKLVTPTYKEMLNSAHETPAMVFTKEHKKLVIEGEKWMKETAQSCTIAAALIVTVVFAAAITVPGGSNENGLPVFHEERAFLIFAISDAISLFTSTTSLLMFLSILTSRYAESDFLLVLPRRLIIGLLTLFVSISTMMMAFCATLYLLIEHRKAWHLVPLVALASLPVTSSAFLQFPLLVDVIRSTYFPLSFGKQNK